MKTDNDLILSFTAKVSRTKGPSASEIHVDVVIETSFEATIAEFSNEHVYNLLILDNAKHKFNITKFDIYLIPTSGTEPAEKPVKLEKPFTIEKSKGAEFEFDEEKNSVFMTEVKIKGVRPDGTRRRVITYEDSDEIDEGIG